MAMLDYLNKVVALPDGTKIGIVEDIEREVITQRFFALIALNPPWKGKTIKIQIGELRKIADEAFALSTQYAASVKKELYGEDEPIEIKPTSPPPTPKESRPLTPQVTSLPPTRPPPTKSPPTSTQSTPSVIPTKDTTVWSQISKQISGKQKDKAPTSQITPPSHERPTMPPRKDQPQVTPAAHTPPTPPASPIEHSQNDRRHR